MRIQYVAAVAIVAGLIGWTAGSGFGEDTPPSPEQLVEMMREAGKPGPMHKKLEQMAGSWSVQAKSWHAPGEPTVSPATSTSKMILGGRFLLSQYKGDMFGNDFNGVGLMGYNNNKKQFESIWIDDFSSNISHSTGQAQADGSIVFKGMWEGPNDMKSPYRMVYTPTASGYNLVSYAEHDGEEVKEMEMAYSRAAGGATTPAVTPAATPAPTPAPPVTTYDPCQPVVTRPCPPPPVQWCPPRPSCRPRCR